MVGGGIMSVRGFTLGTDYTELDGDQCTLDKGKLTGRRVFRLKNYENYPTFLACLGGGIEASGGTPNYNPPHQFRNDIQLWCQGATVEGIGVPTRGASGNPSFDGGAKITATYETLDYDPQTIHGRGSSNSTPGVYVTESRSTAGKTLQLTKKGSDHAPVWKFSGGANITDDLVPDFSKTVAQGEYRLTLHYLPTVNQSTINGLIGKVNNAQFPTVSSMGGFVSGTLLFMGDDTEREYTADGTTIAYTMTLKFLYDPNGWNYEYSPAAKAFALVELIADSSKHPYEYADFTPLLRTTS